MIKKFEFIGITKDGKYGQTKELDLTDATIIKADKVITENGYVDLKVAVDEEGRFLWVSVERTNIGI